MAAMLLCGIVLSADASLEMLMDKIHPNNRVKARDMLAQYVSYFASLEDVDESKKKNAGIWAGAAPAPLPGSAKKAARGAGSGAGGGAGGGAPLSFSGAAKPAFSAVVARLGGGGGGGGGGGDIDRAREFMLLGAEIATSAARAVAEGVTAGAVKATLAAAYRSAGYTTSPTGIVEIADDDDDVPSPSKRRLASAASLEPAASSAPKPPEPTAASAGAGAADAPADEDSI